MLTKKHTKDSNKKARAVAYVRVSSKKQAEEGVSILLKLKNVKPTQSSESWVWLMKIYSLMMESVQQPIFGQDLRADECVKSSMNNV